MPPFDLHAFISYAHIDNEPMEPGQAGWVSRFHAGLQARLSQRLGEQARIWRDQKLAGNDIFGDEIVQQLSRAALLVSILTPRYVRSEWCTRELDEFAEAAMKSGGVRVGNTSRVVTVKKTPLDADAKVPPLVERTLCYEFWEDDDGHAEEIDPALGDEARHEFLRRVSNLAVEMADSLHALARAEAGAAAPAQSARGGLTVFVAECGRDMHDAREQIVTDLRLHGHQVLPSQQLPSTEDALRAEAGQQLAQSALALHLVGAATGPIPDGPSGRSSVMLQNELAAERSRVHAMPRLIWLPDGVRGERPEQQGFIDALLREAGPQQGADLLRGDLEAFKGALHGALRKLQAPPAGPVPGAASGPAAVHLLMTESDRLAVVPLIKALRAKGLAVSLPVFTGDAAQVRALNAQLVAASRAVLVYYGAGDEAWKVHQLNDLRKQAALRSAPPAQWLLLATPVTPDKELLQALAEPDTLDLLAGPSDAALAPVLSAVEATQAREGSP